MELSAGADKSGGEQCRIPRSGYDPRHFVFRKTRYGVLRLPQTRTVRIRRAVHPVCVPRIHADGAAVYLGYHRIGDGYEFF